MTHEPPSDGRPLIDVVGLSVAYNGRLALEQIEFRLQPGSRLAVVGPNGAGKTTLFKVLAGILPPASGSVVVHGHPPGEHLCVAYVPQRTEVDWRFPVNVRDVVMMGRVRDIGLFRWPVGRDERQVEQALVQVGLAELANRQIGDLSSGQQQRVFLAQAVVQAPQIVLLDEPLSGLDGPSQTAILGILDELNEAGVTIVVATHDLKLASNRFDRVLLLNRRQIAVGPPDQVLTQNHLVKAYAGGLQLLDGGSAGGFIADAHLASRD